VTKRNSKMRFLDTVSLVLALGGPGSLGITSDVKGNGNPDVRPPFHEAVATCQYTMTARVRLLLFWISRQGVGGGRIAWSEGADGSRAVELLIGSDPERAPMRINRWGYIVERVVGSSAELIGVMTESEEQSIEQAQIAVSRSGATHSFKGIRGSLSEGFAQSTTLHLLLSEDFTFRSADTLLRQLPQNGSPIRQTRVPDGTEPGFLFALKGLVHDSVENFLRSGEINAGRQSRCRFVYAGSLYELTRRSSRLVQEDTVNGRTYHGVIKSEFETCNLATGEMSRFSITYGSQPPFTETPIRIVYRPRWWFEAELLLAGEPEVAEAVGRETAWSLGTK
jgi:hypothetical protein